MAWQEKLQKVTELPAFSSENYTESQSLSSEYCRESQNGLAGKITENYRELHSDLALVAKITKNHRLPWLQRITEL